MPSKLLSPLAVPSQTKPSGVCAMLKTVLSASPCTVVNVRKSGCAPVGMTISRSRANQ